MTPKTRLILLAAAFGAAAGLAGGAAEAREEIRMVGSSTVYPFATVVAERFGKTTNHPTPVIESTGTGGGFKLFCGGAGVDTPDISNASRAIKSSELDACKANTVGDVVEVKIGYDGIVIANSAKAASFNLTLAEVFLALAKDVPDAKGNFVANPYKTWNQVNPKLPNARIEVLGPPPTSGTRDAFNELAMEGGCNAIPAIKALKDANPSRHKQICLTLREDGAFIEAGENDNFIVQKLAANPNALGVFGFSFLDQNMDKVHGARVNGVEPTFENIADGSYPISRPLFFYVKRAHIGVVPGLKEYVLTFLDEGAMGEEGYLADRGLIPMPAAEYAAVKQKVTAALGK